MKRTSRVSTWLSAITLTALVLTGCGQETEEDAAPAPTPTPITVPGPTEAPGGETIRLGFIPTWNDNIATGYLWTALLEDAGYTVEVTEINEPSALYTALASGSIDVYPSGWPQIAQADQMNQFREELEDLGAYYDNARLTLAVPEYTDVDSIADLPDNTDLFDGRIVGIEPGSGLNVVTEDSVFTAYGLDADYAFVESSTAAMLDELDSAIDAQEDIVVTLWRPFWPYAEYPLKDLDDPEDAFGSPETLNIIANATFSEQFPEVADVMRDFTLSDEQFAELDDLMANEFVDDPLEGARSWLAANPDAVPALG